MEFQTPDFYPAMPEIFVAAMAVLMLLAVSFAKKKEFVAYCLSQFTVLGAGVISIASRIQFGGEPSTWMGVSVITRTVSTFSGMYVDDMFGDLLKIFACIAVAITLLYNRAYMRDRRIESAEYYLLVMFALLGIMVMISANSLLTVYLGLELLSLASYALVAIDRDSAKATEAAMKYFVLGALSSGLLLYGISMVYGATQTLLIPEILMRFLNDQVNVTVLLFGLVFVVAGLAFKLGVVPFHMWIPDVYQGAPSSITLMVASAPKLAAFAITYRVLAFGMFGLSDQWQMMLMLLAVGSIVLGNLVAISQTNIKRMLAYSAISHMGFMLLGLASGGGTSNLNFAHNAYTASLFYVVTYVLTTLAAFGVILLLSRTGFEAENIDDLKGLNKRNSWWAAMMSIVMFSMAGIPFFVGFFSKFFILQAVIATGYWWLAVLAVVMSLIGAFYYLRVVKVIYFDEPVDTAPVTASWGIQLVLSANVLAVALLGVFPSMLMVICSIVIAS